MGSEVDRPLLKITLPGKNKRIPVHSYRADASKSIQFLDAGGQVLLEHVLSANNSRPTFWTNEIDAHLSKSYTLASNADVTLKTYNLSTVPPTEKSFTDRPVYSFKSWSAYKNFQSELRKIDFLADYPAKIIRPPSRPSNDLAVCASSSIKLWHNRDDDTGSITIPLSRTSKNTIVLQDLQCVWLEIEKNEFEASKKSELRIQLKANKPGKMQRSSTTQNFGGGDDNRSHSKLSIVTKVTTWGSRNPSTTPPETMRSGSISSCSDASIQNTAPPQLIARLDPIIIEFREPQVRTDFLNAIKRFLVGSPTISRPDSVFSKSGRAASISSSMHSQEAPQSIGSSPKALSPRTNGSMASTSPLVATAPVNEAADRIGEHSTRLQQTTSPPSPPPHSSPPALRVPRPPLARIPSMTEPPPLPPPVLPPPNIPGHTAPEQPDMNDHSFHTRPPSRSNSLQDPADLAVQRKFFWQRQVASAAIAGTARIRAQMNERFYQRPLQATQQLRLLKILPADSYNSDLVLEFDIFRLDQVQNEYEALSYAWGRGDKTREVTLNNEPGFIVSQHLEQALKRMRLGNNQAHIVWVDAICINQMDVLEMNHQVRLMGDIYKLAKRTIIWIGELTPHMPTCERRVRADGGEAQSRTLCTKEGAPARDHGLESSIKGPLADFIKRLHREESFDAWHLRLWCVQEFHFSEALPTVYVGAHAIGWSHFASIFRQVDRENASLALFEELRARKQRHQQQNLHDISTMTGSMKVGNPRDRIYSLLHMTADNPAKITADYKKSVLEVLEDATLSCILESNSVDVLLDSRLDRSQGDGYGRKVLPSFVPDFTCLQTRQFSAGNVDYDTGDGTPPYAYLSHDTNVVYAFPEELDIALPRVLTVGAKYFDRIKRRTTVNNIPPHETSPSGELIYNGFQKPGSLLKSILEALHFRFEIDMTRFQISRSPQLGRLILEYLLEEERSYIDEIDRCTSSAEVDLLTVHQHECERDHIYAAAMNANEPDRDADFINKHWILRQSYVENEDNTVLDIRNILKDREAESPWNQVLHPHAAESLRTDMQAAMEFENLFCYARKTQERYYFSGNKQYRPMRKDVLKCRSFTEARGLRTQANDPDDAIDFHKYSEKVRERDFFCTDSGFIGLGPTVMRPGDEIVVPCGASRPFLLRPSPDSSGTHTLIGEVIVPGIMHGEWMAKPEIPIHQYRLR